MRISAAAVNRIAEEEFLNRGTFSKKKRLSLDRFSAIFGCSPTVAAALWNRLDAKGLLPSDCLVKHLLWGMSFLKLYNVQRVQAPVICGADEKTFRKWVWLMLDALSECDLVRCQSRRIRRRPTSTRCASMYGCLLTVDSSSSAADQVGEPVHA